MMKVCRGVDDPGWPRVALAYRASVDVPARFHRSKSVGAVFGLTCSKYQPPARSIAAAGYHTLAELRRDVFICTGR